jgi:hypothetical protein
MQKATKDLLTVRAAELARAAPTSWDGFLKAVRVLADDVGMEMVSYNDPTSILRMQGRAQLAASLLTLFDNAVRDADGLQKRVEKRGT